MGAKGAIDIEKQTATFITVMNLVKGVGENTTAVYMHRDAIAQENDTNSDPQTRDQLADFCQSVTDTYKHVEGKLQFISETLNKVIGKAEELNKRSQSRMSGINESAAAVRKKAGMGGKR